MSAINDSLFGLHTQALDTWQKRSEVLASNLANADTPGYLARDIDFKKALSSANASGNSLSMTITQQGQIDPAAQAADQLAWRTPSQPTMDGNTVDTQVEQANFAANGV